MRFTAALRRFIAPSKHKMPGREACMRVGTPPLHFYRRLPDKLGNIPPISCSRERSCPAISDSLLLSLLPSPPPHSKRGHWLSLAASLFRPAVKFILFLISYSEFCSLHRNLYISSSESLFSALTEARSLSDNHHLKIYYLKNTSKKYN